MTLSKREYLDSEIVPAIEAMEEMNIPAHLQPVVLDKMVSHLHFINSENRKNGEKVSQSKDPKDSIEASPKQISYIKQLGGTPKKNMSMNEASAMIDGLKKKVE